MPGNEIIVLSDDEWDEIKDLNDDDLIDMIKRYIREGSLNKLRLYLSPFHAAACERFSSFLPAGLVEAFSATTPEEAIYILYKDPDYSDIREKFFPGNEWEAFVCRTPNDTQRVLATFLDEYNQSLENKGDTRALRHAILELLSLPSIKKGMDSSTFPPSLLDAEGLITICDTEVNPKDFELYIQLNHARYAATDEAIKSKLSEIISQYNEALARIDGHDQECLDKGIKCLLEGPGQSIDEKLHWVSTYVADKQPTKRVNTIFLKMLEGDLLLIEALTPFYMKGALSAKKHRRTTMTSTFSDDLTEYEQAVVRALDEGIPKPVPGRGEIKQYSQSLTLYVFYHMILYVGTLKMNRGSLAMIYRNTEIQQRFFNVFMGLYLKALFNEEKKKNPFEERKAALKILFAPLIRDGMPASLADDFEHFLPDLVSLEEETYQKQMAWLSQYTEFTDAIDTYSFRILKHQLATYDQAPEKETDHTRIARRCLTPKVLPLLVDMEVERRQHLHVYINTLTPQHDLTFLQRYYLRDVAVVIQHEKSKLPQPELPIEEKRLALLTSLEHFQPEDLELLLERLEDTQVLDLMADPIVEGGQVHECYRALYRSTHIDAGVVHAFLQLAPYQHFSAELISTLAIPLKEFVHFLLAHPEVFAPYRGTELANYLGDQQTKNPEEDLIKKVLCSYCLEQEMPASLSKVLADWAGNESKTERFLDALIGHFVDTQQDKELVKLADDISGLSLKNKTRLYRAIFVEPTMFPETQAHIVRSLTEKERRGFDALKEGGNEAVTNWLMGASLDSDTVIFQVGEALEKHRDCMPAWVKKHVGELEINKEACEAIFLSKQSIEGYLHQKDIPTLSTLLFFYLSSCLPDHISDVAPWDDILLLPGVLEHFKTHYGSLYISKVAPVTSSAALQKASSRVLTHCLSIPEHSEDFSEGLIDGVSKLFLNDDVGVEQFRSLLSMPEIQARVYEKKEHLLSLFPKDFEQKVTPLLLKKFSCILEFSSKKILLSLSSTLEKLLAHEEIRDSLTPAALYQCRHIKAVREHMVKEGFAEKVIYPTLDPDEQKIAATHWRLVMSLVEYYDPDKDVGEEAGPVSELAECIKECIRTFPGVVSRLHLPVVEGGMPAEVIAYAVKAKRHDVLLDILQDPDVNAYVFRHIEECCVLVDTSRLDELQNEHTDRESAYHQEKASLKILEKRLSGNPAYAELFAAEDFEETQLERFRSLLVERYKETPAKALIYEAEFDLPVDYESFDALFAEGGTIYEHLSKQQALGALTEARNAANSELYSHPSHCALRFISEPNHWIEKPSIAKYTEGGESTLFRRHLTLFAQVIAITLDDNAPGNHESDDRIRFLENGFAQMLRQHNWDKQRPDGSQYDDMLPDNPVCQMGMPTILLRTLFWHPELKIVIDNEFIDLKLKEIIKAHPLSSVDDHTKYYYTLMYLKHIQYVDLTPAQQGWLSAYPYYNDDRHIVTDIVETVIDQLPDHCTQEDLKMFPAYLLRILYNVLDVKGLTDMPDGGILMRYAQAFYEACYMEDDELSAFEAKHSKPSSEALIFKSGVSTDSSPPDGLTASSLLSPRGGRRERFAPP